MTPAILLAVLASASNPDPKTLGDLARRALTEQRFRSLLPARQPVRLELPEGDVGVQTPGALAAVLLERRLARQTTTSASVRRTQLLDDRHGFVELVRRFETRGSQEVRAERVLLGISRGEGGWQVVEVLVLGGAGAE